MVDDVPRTPSVARCPCSHRAARRAEATRACQFVAAKSRALLNGHAAGSWPSCILRFSLDTLQADREPRADAPASVEARLRYWYIHAPAAIIKLPGTNRTPSITLAFMPNLSTFCLPSS